MATPPTATIKVAAGAGCGKTSTLAEYGRRWPANGLYIAFNRSIADEARRKFPSRIDTRTGHSVAYRALKIHERGGLINKFQFDHLRAYDDMIGKVPGMTDGQVRAAILRTLGNFLIDSGTKRLCCTDENRDPYCPVPPDSCALWSWFACRIS